MCGPSLKDRGNGESKVSPHSLSGLLSVGDAATGRVQDLDGTRGVASLHSFKTSETKTVEEEEKQTIRGQRWPKNASREVKKADSGSQRRQVREREKKEKWEVT